MTTRMWIILRPLLALLLLGGSATAAPNPRLRKLAVVGDSVLAGFASGGLVATGRVGQRDSAPALVARQAHVAFSQPLMTGPGLPPPLVIVDENRDGVLDPGDVARAIDGIGFRREPGRIVRNLAVPGEDMRSVFQTTTPGTITEQLLNGSADGRDLMKFAILGLPVRSEGVSQLTRLQDIRPTFVLVWLGNNDVLPMATRTDPAAVTMSAAEFGQRYRQLLNALADTGVGGMAVANLPDVTALPALRPAGSEVTVCRADDGTATAVAPDDLLMIDLPRDRLPEPPCGRVLDAAERAAVRATVIRFNDEIASAVADVEASRGDARSRSSTCSPSSIACAAAASTASRRAISAACSASTACTRHGRVRR